MLRNSGSLVREYGSDISATIESDQNTLLHFAVENNHKSQLPQAKQEVAARLLPRHKLS